jgi:hypothetical protein
MSTLVLLAQAAEAAPPGGMSTSVMVVLIVAAVMAVPITAIIVGVKHATKERELAHAERLKALEKGINLDEIEEERRFRRGMMRLAAGIGVVVPICAVGAATGAVTGMGATASSAIVFLIWTSAASIGVAGVASGAWLAQAAATRFKGARGENRGSASYPRSYEAETAAAG